LKAALFFIAVLACAAVAEAQLAPITGVDPSASASAAPNTQRGTGTPTVATQEAGKSTNILGSQSYTYVVPMLHLPGRNGLDLNLNLYYNSLIWPLNSNSTNADYDNPSLGFRLDYGFFDWGSVFMDPNGTKHPLTMLTDVNPATTWHFATTDSTYIDIKGPKFVGICPGPLNCQQPNLTVTFKNGQQGIYENFNFQHGGGWRPIQFTDMHGNQISIAYLNGTTLAISSITDSTGRVVNFTYDSNGNLSSFGYGQHIFNFSWNTGYQVKFNFNAQGVTTLPPISVLTGVTRPDGTGVRFVYGDWGIVNEIDELSASGNTRYSTSYNFPLASAGTLTSNPTYTTQTVFDGVNSNVQWNYAVTTDPNTSEQSAAVTDPTGVTTTNVFSADGSGLVTQQRISSVEQSGNTKVWRILNQSWTTDSSGLNPRLSAMGTILEDGSASGVQYVSYDANGNVTDKKDFDFSQPLASNLTLAPGIIPTPGPLLRETIAAFATLTGIRSRPAQTVIKDAQANTISRTDFNYDEGATTVRGDLTSSIRYANAAAGTGGIKASMTYDTYGNIVKVQEGCCATTQMVFSSATNFTYPDTVSVGPQGNLLTTSYTYNPDGSLLTSTDPNGVITTYGYDSSGRVTSVAQSPGITDKTSFDVLSVTPSVTKSNTGNSLVQVRTFDGAGRRLSDQQLNGSTPVSTTAYTNDLLGRPEQITNPYGPGETQVFTTVQYDVLGRVTQVTPPASSGASQNSYTASYAGVAAALADPAGRQRIHYSDALGRLVRVDEPGPNGGQTATASLIVSGVEQSVASTSSSNGATAGTASLTIGGSADRSTQVLTHATTSASVTVTVGGSDGVNNRITQICTRTCRTFTSNFADSGTIAFSVTAGGATIGPVSVPYNSTSTPASLAGALAGGLPSNSLVSVSYSSGSASFTLTTLATGSATNNTFLSTSLASSCVPSDTDTTSTICNQGWTITPSQNFAGGTDNVFTTAYDTGTVVVSITANGSTYSKTSNYGQNSTPSSIANDLYNQFIADNNFNQVVRTSPPGSGSTLQFTTVANGAGTQYPLNTSSSTTSPNFVSGSTSFSISPLGASTFTPGQNGTLYDAGTVTVTLNGFTDATAPSKQVSYGQGSNAAGIAAQLASLMHSDPAFPVDASVANGSTTISLSARAQGAAANNYTIKVTGASSLSASFPNPSFPNSPASSSPISVNLLGGIDPTPALTQGVALTTLYAYDPLGNLLQVNQGPQTRKYGYDSLGRLVSSCTPEAAGQCQSLSYTDFDGVQQRLDPRVLPGTSTQLTTTYGFDSWNNVNDIQYNDGTSEAKFTFGAQGAANNGAGRLISRNDGTGSQSYKYDPQGRVTQVSWMIGGVTYAVGYGYTPSGELTTLTYPSGRTVTLGRDGVDRLTGVSTNNSSIFTVGSYNGAGQPLTVSFSNGMHGTYGYDNQQHLNSIQFGNSAGNLLNLAYDYGSSNNNGQVRGITDKVNAAQSTSYVYDELGRLKGAQTTDLTSPNTWQLSFSYDRFGNRLSEVPTAGTALLPLSETPTDPSTNHILGYAYDVAGNMTADGLHTYAFDAENRLIHVDGNANTFGYDATGLRIKKNGTVYIFANGQVIAEYATGAAAANPTVEYIYADSLRVATVTNGVISFPYHDQLSTRVTADGNGQVIRTYGHYPFGETWYQTGTPDKWDFTTYERDQASEGALDYAMARFYSNRIGRFLSLDPLSGGTGSPQSLNRYAYVGNDPINFTDPTGLLWADDPTFLCLLDDKGDPTSVCAKKPGSDPADVSFMFDAFMSQEFDAEADLKNTDPFHDILGPISGNPLTNAEKDFDSLAQATIAAYKQAQYIDQHGGWPVEFITQLPKLSDKDLFKVIGIFAHLECYKDPIKVSSIAQTRATNVNDTGKPRLTINVPKVTLKAASNASSQGQLRTSASGSSCFRADGWQLLEETFRNPAASVDATSSSNIACVK